MTVTACQALKDRLMAAGATGAPQQGETWRPGQLAILGNFISKNYCQCLYSSKSLAPVSSCYSAFLQLPGALWSTFSHPLPPVNLVMENPSLAFPCCYLKHTNLSSNTNTISDNKQRESYYCWPRILIIYSNFRYNPDGAFQYSVGAGSPQWVSCKRNCKSLSFVFPSSQSKALTILTST